MNILKYLDRDHEYGVFDCITLVTLFYKIEFGIHITLPEYPKSDKWITSLSSSLIDSYLKKYSTKIDLQFSKNYDLLVFSNKNNIMHFGIFLLPFHMLHIVKGQRAKVELINSYWKSKIYNVYRLV